MLIKTYETIIIGVLECDSCLEENGLKKLMQRAQWNNGGNYFHIFYFHFFV